MGLVGLPCIRRFIPECCLVRRMEMGRFLDPTDSDRLRRGAVKSVKPFKMQWCSLQYFKFYVFLTQDVYTLHNIFITE